MWAVGAPSRFRLSQPATSLVPCPRETLLAVVSPSRVQLWAAAEHKLRLASVSCPGAAAAAFNGDGSGLAVVAGGQLLFFAVTPGEPAVALSCSALVDAPAGTAASRRAIRTVTLEQQDEALSFGAAAGASTVTAGPRGHLLVGTAAGVVLLVHWSGDVARQELDAGGIDDQPCADGGCFCHAPSVALGFRGAGGVAEEELVSLPPLPVPPPPPPPVATAARHAQAARAATEDLPPDLEPIPDFDFRVSLSSSSSSSDDDDDDQPQPQHTPQRGPETHTPQPGVHTVLWSNPLLTVAALFANGAVVARAVPAGERVVVAHRGVTAAALSRRDVLALGLATGATRLLRLHAGGATTPLRELDLRAWQFGAADVGAVSALAFDRAGVGLAVGHAGRGLSVWDAAGGGARTRFFSTLPELNDAALVRDTEPLVRGVSALAWTAGGSYEVLASGAGAGLQQFSFVRSAVASGFGQTASLALWAQGASSLRVLEACSWDAAALAWTRVRLPAAFRAEHWPVALVAASPSGQHVAATGARGLLVYSLAQRRWRLFGNVAQERALAVRAMAWWGDQAVIVAAGQGARFELRAFDPDHLSSDPLFVLQLPEGPPPRLLQTDDAGARLAVVTGAQLLCYDLRGGTPALVSQERLPADQARAVAVFVLPGGGAGPRCALLSHTGRLVVSPGGALVADGVARVWPQRCPSWPEQIRDCYWLHSDGGLRVWFPSLDVAGTGAGGQHCLLAAAAGAGTGLQLDVEASLLGVSPAHEVLLSAAQRVHYGAPGTAPVYDGAASVQPCLHIPLQLLLDDGFTEWAETVALLAAPHALIAHALELLLHFAVEQAAAGDSGARLLQVVELLRRFPCFEEAVANVARKGEEKHWRALFPVVGSPQALFDACLERGDLRVAARFLVLVDAVLLADQHEDAPGAVLETMSALGVVATADASADAGHNGDERVSTPGGLCAVRLLRRALDEGDFELAAEAVHFLSPGELSVPGVLRGVARALLRDLRLHTLARLLLAFPAHADELLVLAPRRRSSAAVAATTTDGAVARAAESVVWLARGISGLVGMAAAEESDSDSSDSGGEAEAAGGGGGGGDVGGGGGGEAPMPGLEALIGAVFSAESAPPPEGIDAILKAAMAGGAFALALACAAAIDDSDSALAILQAQPALWPRFERHMDGRDSGRAFTQVLRVRLRDMVDQHPSLA